MRKRYNGRDLLFLYISRNKAINVEFGNWN